MMVGHAECRPDLERLLACLLAWAQVRPANTRFLSILSVPDIINNEMYFGSLPRTMLTPLVSTFHDAWNMPEYPDWITARPVAGCLTSASSTDGAPLWTCSSCFRVGGAVKLGF